MTTVTGKPVVTETPDDLQVLFTRLGINAVTYSHPAVFTVEEGRDIDAQMPGGHTKNLFLRDKKENQWLVTALGDTKVDLKWLAAHLGAGRFSFGSPERLMNALGLTPGSVTPFGLVNDREKQVRFALDAAIFDYDLVNCHPLRNDMTTAMAPKDLQKFIESLGYTIEIIDFTVA